MLCLWGCCVVCVGLFSRVGLSGDFLTDRCWKREFCIKKDGVAHLPKKIATFVLCFVAKQDLDYEQFKIQGV